MCKLTRYCLQPPQLSLLLHNPVLRPYFQRFVSQNFDSDGLNFYLAVRDFVSESNVTKQALKARVIIERFISLDSFDTLS